MEIVVDTNVGVVANNDSAGHASPECVLACVRRLQTLMRGERLVLDDDWRIVREYKDNLRPSGQPGVGTAFLKWVLTNLRNPDRCRMVRITPRSEDERDFEEFPRGESLRGFDPSDRKFVAVSMTSRPPIPVLQAVDSGWWRLRHELRANGAIVDFICPDDIQQGRRSRR